jgi:excinuclease ABC subunit A
MNNSISPATHLIIKGARQHNLKNIDLELPKNKFIVFTGLSGSGKSSLAFDTIYAEGQRRYVESLSSYARQFLGLMQKPDVDQIDGLSPAISIDQKTTSHNPRSTVGTITEIYDYLRLLFARVGHPHCPDCNLEIAPQSVDQITQSMAQVIQSHAKTVPQARFLLISPVVKDKKGEFAGLFENLRKKGFDRVRIDGRFYSLDEDFVLIKTNRHSISTVIDRITFDKSSLKDETKLEALNRRLAQGIESALALSQGQVILSQINDQSFDFPAIPTDYTDTLYSQAFACPNCGRSFAPIEPRLFSFNTPHGACPTCTGLGSLLKVDPTKIIAPDLTLSEGAIIPLSNALSSDSWYARKLKSVVEAENSFYTIPYHQIPPETKEIILYGSRKYYHVSGDNRQGRTASFSFQHEGVVNELERRYLETQSDFIRTEISRFMKRETCPDCNGARLKPESLSVTIADQNINHIVGLPINKSIAWINTLKQNKDQDNAILTLKESSIATPIIKEINSRLDFLSAVGLEYLTLNREAATLAGGEAQRIRLASQIGTGLTGVLYVLDEPTIGLHPRDNLRLISTLTKLRDLGNTVIVVEHDQTVMEAADILVDFGPRAGARVVK